MAKEMVLTPTHKKILHQASRGLTSREIGDKIGMAKRTVDTHKIMILRANRCKNITQAVATAIRKKVI